MVEMVTLQDKSALVVITGASRGIGRELSIQLSKLFIGGDSTFILIARNETALNEVKEEILKESLTASVEIIIADLSEPFTIKIDEQIRQLEENSKFKFDIRMVIHNAASLGDLTKKSSELNDQEQWAKYLQMNLISTIYLNNLIYSALNKEVNFKTYSSFTQYSVGKAAREAYFRSFAVEQPNCRVLSYSPGPVDTQMHTEVCANTYDTMVKDVFSRRYEESNLHRRLLSSTETVQRFIKILELDKFENGSRVDFFDKQF